jgi:hypothetical protein
MWRYVVFILLSLLWFTPAVADDSWPVFEGADDPEWMADKKRAEALFETDNCDDYWQIVWPWVKKGNMDARALLWTRTVPMIHMPIVRPPASENVISYLRHLFIITMYNSGNGILLEEDGETLEQYVYSFIPFVVDSSVPFAECINDTPSPKCMEIAVEEKIIPSFEDYAAEIDVLMKNGYLGTCEIGYRHTKIQESGTATQD